MADALPPGARLLADFAGLLRAHGFAVVADQTIAFLRAVTLLGPRRLADIYDAARAMLAPPPERRAEFDALFAAHFRGEAPVPTLGQSLAGDEQVVAEAARGAREAAIAGRANPTGAAATHAEALSVKTFRRLSPDEHLARLKRRLPGLAPRRRGFRLAPAPRPGRLDLRRSLADLVHDGRARPEWRDRREAPRRVLILIDISGSMKAHTADYLRFAHAVTSALPAVECFTFGTRLTRITKALRLRDEARALAAAAPAVADWEGGTRIADSIASFLAVPRYSRASRGALTIVLSDGLERGPAAPMASAVRRLAARSWRLAWLTPLAADPEFRAETAAMKAILGIIDYLGDASALAPLCAFIEKSACLGASPPAAGRSGRENERNPGHRRPSPHLAAEGPALARRTDGAAHLRTL